MYEDFIDAFDDERIHITVQAQPSVLAFSKEASQSIWAMKFEERNALILR